MIFVTLVTVKSMAKCSAASSKKCTLLRPMGRTASPVAASKLQGCVPAISSTSTKRSAGQVVSPEPESYKAQISSPSPGGELTESTCSLGVRAKIVSSSSVSGQSYRGDEVRDGVPGVSAAISNTGLPTELLLASRACCARCAVALATSWA